MHYVAPLGLNHPCYSPTRGSRPWLFHAAPSGLRSFRRIPSWNSPSYRDTHQPSESTMSANQAHPNPVPPGGGLSKQSPPQVVVRAGKVYACAACGTLVEIPADVVGQLVGAVEPSEDPSSACLSKEEEPSSPEEVHDVATVATESPSRSSRSSAVSSARSNRAERTPPQALGRERIDGLIVPTTQEMERLLAWIDYRLQQLSHLRQLERQLTPQKAQPVPRRRQRRQTNKVPLRRSMGERRRHAHEDVSMAPSVGQAKERGPP